MCETMANIPIEDNTSYVLTEDMFDAAMTKEFSFQDDIGSGEDFNSPDNTSVDVDIDAQVTIIPESNARSSISLDLVQRRNSSDSTKKPRSDGSSRRVVVIETGLDKINEIFLENKNSEKSTSTDITGNEAEGTTIADCTENTNTSNKTSTSYNTNPDSENFSTTTDDKVPILKSILNCSANQEPIDLCNSDTDEHSDSEITEVEMLDDDLQSVMESNMMAEVGLAANNKISGSVGQSAKSLDTVTSPRLQVKNVTQISPSTFNNMSQSNQPSETHNAELITLNNRSAINSNTEENVLSKCFRFPNFVVNPKKDHSIHLNKIAIPHQTFFGSQGQKMKCIYVKNSAGAPVVINSSQLPSANKNNVAYTMTQQKKQTRLSPTELFTNVTKRQLQFHQSMVPNNQLTLPAKRSVLSVNQPSITTGQSSFPSNHQVLTSNQPNILNYQPIQQRPSILSTAPKTVKTASQSIPVAPPLHKHDDGEVALVKSFLFTGIKKPYFPPELAFRNMTLFECSDCHDRFVIQSSLIHHLDRRSLVVRYWCQICNQELEFFNRCSFMGHLRSHNCPISQLDYSKISVDPLPIEMIQGGAVSTSVTDCPTNCILPYKDCILPQSNKEVVKASKQFSKSSSSNNKAQTSSNLNTAVTTSQPANNKSPMSLLLSKTKRDSLTCTSSTKEVFLVPPSLPKNPALAPVNCLRTYSKDPPAKSTKTVLKKVVLVLDKQNKPVNLNQNAKINVLPPNELFSVSEGMIIDDNSSEEPRVSLEEDIMNVESVPVANGSCITSLKTKSKNTSNNTKRTALPAKSATAKSATAKSETAKSAAGKPSKKLCVECGISCLNISKHLNGSGRPINPNLTCEQCELILPTKCALRCHLRIHDKLPPYKCPDCGKDFTNWDDLLSHLKMSCGHIAKCVRYYCHSCKKHFASKSILANHIKDLHSRDIFRCSSCPVAFYNKTSIDKHMITTVHKEKAFSLSQKQCNMCPTKLMSLEEFESHIQNHTNNNSALMYGYKCPWCSMVYVNKMAFIIHQVEEKKEIENSNNTLLKKKFIKFLSQDTAPSNRERNKKENSHSDFEFVEQFPNVEFNLPASERDPLSSDDWEFLQDQKVKDKVEETCIVCKKRSVLVIPGLNVNKQSLCCKQCSKTLDAQSKVQNGQAKFNNLMNNKFNVSSNMDYEETTEILKPNSARVKKRSCSVEKTQTKSRKRPKSGVPAKRADSYKASNIDLDSDLHMPVKKKVPKKYPDKRIDFGGQSAHIQGQVIAFQSPNELVCAKCKFVADTKETFLEHITVHRMDPNTYQCLECGLCFVVLPSLDRHLRMYHGIQDVYEYMDKNKSSLPKKMYVEETQCLQENQCRVCLETYDSNSSLEKHFRTHGMAFMSSLSKSP